MVRSQSVGLHSGASFQFLRSALVDAFSCPTIPACPEWASGTRSPFGIINSLFMRAANDLIGHDDGLDCMRPDQRKNSATDSLVETHVTLFGEKALQDLWCTGFRAKNCHGHFRSGIGGWPIKRDRGDRIAAKPALGLLLEMVTRLAHKPRCETANRRASCRAAGSFLPERNHESCAVASARLCRRTRLHRP